MVIVRAYLTRNGLDLDMQVISKCNKLQQLSHNLIIKTLLRYFSVSRDANLLSRSNDLPGVLGDQQ